MNKEQIKAKIIDIILNSFNNNGIAREIVDNIDLIKDIGMDSITYIYMVIAIEDNFNITINDDQLIIQNFNNIDSIVAIVDNIINVYYPLFVEYEKAMLEKISV